MSKLRIEGSFVALITPFNKDGAVDFGAFRTLLKFQEDHGTRAVLIMGSTGETSMLAPEEKKLIIVETAKMKSGRMLFFYGCTGNNTEATIANVKFAQGAGADGAILAAPAYICASEADGEQFFLDVADATDLPLGIYNNPPRVKTDLHWDHLLRISSTRTSWCTRSRRRASDRSQILAREARRVGHVLRLAEPRPRDPDDVAGRPRHANMTGNIAPGARHHLHAVDEATGGRGLQGDLPPLPAAAALHLLGDQPGRGQVADEGARPAGGRPAATAARPRRRGAGEGRAHRARARAGREVRL
jgi:4-hydroxy-tetrahydrodipicolinate synthase